MILQLTPSGSQCPETCAPPAGTTRGIPRATGAHNLSPSSITAPRYGSSLTRSDQISDVCRNEERISAVSSFIALGFPNKFPIMPDRAVAVVSLPANTRILSVASISGSLMPFSSLWRSMNVMKSFLWPSTDAPLARRRRMRSLAILM